MKKSNEQKPNIVTSFINFNIIKLKKKTEDNRSKSPVDKFKYELPKSFLKAVDYARVRAGYDILPRRRHRSASPSIHRKTSSSSSSTASPPSLHRSNKQYQANPKFSRSSSTNDIDKVSTQKNSISSNTSLNIHVLIIKQHLQYYSHLDHHFQ